MKRTTLGLFVLLATMSCGGGESTPKSTQSTPAPKKAETAAAKTETAAKSMAEKPMADKKSGGAKMTWDASKGTATVKGMIHFEGAPPERKPVDMSSDANCHGEGVYDEAIVVNNGGLANVAISISDGLDGWDFPDGEGTVDLHQHGCVYTPHMLAMQAGQTITVHNDDPVVHNIHSYSKRNQAFNQAQPAGAPALVKEMKRKDKLFPIKCDMHSWMNCQVVVFDHPFFTVSSKDGSYTLPKLPPGTYTVKAEHEKLGTQTAEVTVGASGTETVDFTFSLSE